MNDLPTILKGATPTAPMAVGFHGLFQLNRLAVPGGSAQLIGRAPSARRRRSGHGDHIPDYTDDYTDRHLQIPLRQSLLATVRGESWSARRSVSIRSRTF